MEQKKGYLIYSLGQSDQERKTVNIHLEDLKTTWSCLGNKATHGHEAHGASLDGRGWSWEYTLKKSRNKHGEPKVVVQKHLLFSFFVFEGFDRAMVKLCSYYGCINIQNSENIWV